MGCLHAAQVMVKLLSGQQTFLEAVPVGQLEEAQAVLVRSQFVSEGPFCLLRQLKCHLIGLEI